MTFLVQLWTPISLVEEIYLRIPLKSLISFFVHLCAEESRLDIPYLSLFCVVVDELVYCRLDLFQSPRAV